MASLSKSKTLFAFTSPRTIEKIIPEIELLIKYLKGQKWNKQSQTQFYSILKNSDAFESQDGAQQKQKDGIAARDRINRAPKALGFVSLDPTIQLTEAGERLLDGAYVEETITRQLMKFQLPSPYHKQTKSTEKYNIKPYLELLRLIYETGGLSKFEIAAFFVPMINKDRFEKTVNDIIDFRDKCKEVKGKINLKEFKQNKFTEIIRNIWLSEISSGKTSTRESSDKSEKNFITTKMSNMKDYADAFYRYIRATGLVGIQRTTKRIYVVESKRTDVEFLLKTVDSNPLDFSNAREYCNYLGCATNIRLLTDDPAAIQAKLDATGVRYEKSDSIYELKVKLEKETARNKEELQRKITEELQSYSQYDDIIETFEQIKSGELPDCPLMLEYNAYRALAMLDHAKYVKGNYKTNDDCMPVSVAGGGISDIVAEYNNFGLIVEVTMSSGSRQYEMEGEPVARHYGKAKTTINKNMYCIFIANKLNADTVAHLRMTNLIASEAYGGKTKIIPMSIDDFITFVATTKDKRLTDEKPIMAFLENMYNYVLDTSKMESDWRRYISEGVRTWV